MRPQLIDKIIIRFHRLGPITGAVLAAGAGYAAAKDSGTVGSTARKVGDATCKGIEVAKEWVEKKIEEHVNNRIKNQR